MAVTAAALLDELMGKHRNVLPNEKFVEKSWEEPDVCKDYLCGFCPNQLFTNTRSDLGTCDKMHDDHLKKQFEESSPSKVAYYHDLFHSHLQRIMGDVSKRIQRGQSRLMTNQEKNNFKLPSQAKEQEKIDMLSNRINELLAKVEELGCQGNVEEAQGVMKLCDQLKDERDQLQNATEQAMELLFSQEKQMEVCQICGAFLIVNDSQCRVDDHLMGKQHMGYAKIKSTLDEIQNKKEQAEEERVNSIMKEREGREKARQQEREERQKRQEEREKGRKDRHSRRSRSKERRSRSRDRDRSRRSRRSRSRERRRSRDRGDRSSRDRSSHHSRRSRSRDRSSRYDGGSRSRDSRSQRSSSRSHRSSRHQSEERRRDGERGKEERGRGNEEREEGEHESNGPEAREEGEIDYTTKEEGTSDSANGKPETTGATGNDGGEDGELRDDPPEGAEPSLAAETGAPVTETNEAAVKQSPERTPEVAEGTSDKEEDKKD